MKNCLLITLLASLFFACCNSDAPRTTAKFNEGWRFSLNADSTAVKPDFDDSQWRTLNLPHDWSIEGDFSPNHPATTGGGALPGGIGWYRKSFTLPKSDTAHQIYLKFDGVYMNSSVYINGKLIGYRPNGYISFEYNITPYLNFGKTPNVIAVKVDNSQQPNSRWYSGSGIYRNVWLTKTDKIHINPWETFITTPEINSESAIINIETTIVNNSKSNSNTKIDIQIIASDGNIVSKIDTEKEIIKDSTATINQSFTILNPTLWQIDTPNLYTAQINIEQNGKIIDQYQVPFGIRNFKFDADSGFYLNGKHTKIRGVCLHHDLGCLGAAINRRAIERQLQMLKAMGCNAIRTSHNAAAPELLTLCDQMGFIVMADFTDIWHKRKTQFDYANYFDQWHERDLESFIKRDRNHPSIFVWCIGNEILEQWADINTDTMNIEQANMILNFANSLSSSNLNDKNQHINTLLATKLANLTKKFDPTRPITTANNEASISNLVLKSDAIDLVGFNYNHQNWNEYYKQNFTQRPLIITESTSALMSRGHYDAPADSMRIWPVRWDVPFDMPVHQCSAYDNCHVPWGTTHEASLRLMENTPHVSGMYIWTGFDYLGEPTPFGWPSRSSYFGIIDLAGFPKDAYYLYQSIWTDEPMVYVFPHWNWTENQDVDIWVYTNMEDAELYINGVSQGVKSKKKNELHLSWPVVFTRGELKAIGRNADGTTREMKIYTASKPERLRLTADRQTIIADGEDLAFVTISVADKYGFEVPYANNQLNFEIEGNAELVGLDNGDATNHESFKGKTHKAFNGKCLAVIKSTKKSGKATLKVNGNGLKEAIIEITTIKSK